MLTTKTCVRNKLDHKHTNLPLPALALTPYTSKRCHKGVIVKKGVETQRSKTHRKHCQLSAAQRRRRYGQPRHHQRKSVVSVPENTSSMSLRRQRRLCQPHQQQPSRGTLTKRRPTKQNRPSTTRRPTLRHHHRTSLHPFITQQLHRKYSDSRTKTTAVSHTPH